MPTIHDFKDRSGAWVTSFWANGRTYKTRLCVIYVNLVARCRDGSTHQRARPTYAGCINGFESFQDFAEWAVQQPGYAVPESQLDKDLLDKGNKIYSKETCVFVPARLNMLLVKSNATRGPRPIGVSTNSRGQIVASISLRGRTTKIGTFPTEAAAFQAYKEAKEAYIKEMAGEFRSVIDPRTYEALMAYEVAITD